MRNHRPSGVNSLMGSGVFRTDSQSSLQSEDSQPGLMPSPQFRPAHRPSLFESSQRSEGGGGIQPAVSYPASTTSVRNARNTSEGVAAVLGGSTRGSTSASTPTKTHSTPTGPSTPGSFTSGVKPTLRAEAAHEPRVLSSSGKTTKRPIKLQFGHSTLKGPRPTMEDAYFEKIYETAVPAPSTPQKGQGGTGMTTVGLFGVLDGHCGKHVADLGAKMIPQLMEQHPKLGADNGAVIRESILTTDKRIFDEIGKVDGGSTVITALIYGNMLFVGCLGDARAVAYDGSKGVALSVDHKPTVADEHQRIARAGGFVHFGRVGGCLAVSRALGDYEFKFDGRKFVQGDFVVSNVADVTQMNITDDTHFVILACDGIWDVFSSEDAAQFVAAKLGLATMPAGLLTKSLSVSSISSKGSFAASSLNKAPPPPSSGGPVELTKARLEQAAAALTQAALDKGSMDNVTAVVIGLH